MKATEVNASFKTLGLFDLVEVKFPGENDPHLKFIRGHKIKIGQNGQTKEINIAPHWRRGDLFNGNFVTRKFFVDYKLLGKTIVVDQVEVVEKTDHARGDKKSIILNIFQEKLGRQNREAKYCLKVGAPTGQFPISGTENRFIKLEELE